MSSPESRAPSRGSPPSQRLRLRFAKGESLKYISHLDLVRAWERAFRRAGLPIAFSQGFNPRPRFQVAAALPVGVTGSAELLDVWLAEPWEPGQVLDRLRAALPPGLAVLDASEVAMAEPSLQSRLVAAVYRAAVHSPEPLEAIEGRVRALLAAPSLPRRRQHKGEWQTYDLRPLVQSIGVEPGVEGEAALTMRLQASPQGAGRPEEVLDVLGLSPAPHAVERTALLFSPA